MKPDRFDILVSFIALALIAGAVVIGTGAPAQSSAVRPIASRVKAEPDPSVYPKLDAARTLLNAGQAGDAAEMLGGLAKEYPGEAEVYALAGQAYARLLDYPKAMESFRRALLIDPDYADKKSGKFIGKRIKAAVDEGMAGARSALEKDPADDSARAALKDAYYLDRMLAGGCE